MDEIDGKNPNLIRLLAAQGLPAEDIAGMTRTDLAFVREVLSQSADPQGKPSPVNTTSKDE